MKEKKTENEMEQWNDVKENKSGPIMIIILLLIIVALGGFIFLKRDVLFGDNTKEKSNNTQETSETETNEENKPVEIKPLDLAKCLNCEDNWIISDPTEENTSSHFTMSEKTISINWETFHSYSGLSAAPRDVRQYEVRGINGNIKSSIIGGSGQSIDGTTFYYLLENGTVEYVKLFKINTDAHNNTYTTLNFSQDNSIKDEDGNATNYFESQGTVPNISNIVKLYNVQVHVENGSGHATTIGALADGSFYDLKVN